MRWRVALLAVLALGACGRPAPATVDARAPLFRVSDGDTTIWLLGGVHLLPPQVRWRTPALEHAIKESQELVLESSPDDKADFAGVAKGQGLKPVADRVAPADRGALDLLITETGVPRATLDGQKSWAAATTLATDYAMKSGATIDNGVETILWRAFAGRTRAAFYKAQDQIAMLDALPPDLQDQMLAKALSPSESYITILRAWEKGDLHALDPTSDCSPLAGRLVGQPNNRWANWIAARMKRPGTILVAVGAGHLAGPYALQDMLKARGLKVERVQ
jgi:uncharacterized protein YbaP (TraB family)